jgi:hypothetical protein
MQTNRMGKQATCVFLLFAMLSELGCAGRETILVMEPPPDENPGIEFPADVKVSLKEETALKGHRGETVAIWKTKQINGEITGWRDGVIVFYKDPLATGSPYKWSFAVPVEKIERIGFLGPSSQSGGFWNGMALGVFTVVATFMLYALALSQSTVSFR